MRYFTKEYINDSFDGFNRAHDREMEKTGDIFCMGKWTRVCIDIQELTQHGSVGAALNGEQEQFVRMFAAKEPEDYSYRVTLTEAQFNDIKKTLFAPNVRVIELVRAEDDLC